MNKVLIATILFLASCKSTESINRFAKAAVDGSSEISQTSFGFGQFCKLYDPVSLERLTDTSLYAKADHPAVHCGEYKTSDSLVRIIQQSLLNYFSLLQAVSDKKLLAYNANALVSSLSDLQPRVLPALSFSSEKVSAVKGLLNTVLNEPLKIYRSQKLKRVMQENDSTLAVVILGYEFILDSALQGEIDQAIANYTSFVYARWYGWARTPVEKAFINDRYTSFLKEMEGERLKIHKSVRILETIRKDHHALAFAKTKTFREVEKEMKEDILLINELMEELIRLTQ